MNKFSLYSTVKGYQEAEEEIDECINNFMKDLETLQKKWKHFGAWDSASIEAQAMYIAKEKLRIIRLA